MGASSASDEASDRQKPVGRMDLLDESRERAATVRRRNFRLANVELSGELLHRAIDFLSALPLGALVG